MTADEFEKKAGGRPHYLDQNQARQLLGEMGVELTERQMKRATEIDAEGQRKLPFFVDPIDGRLKIDKNTLLRVRFKSL